VTLLADYMTLRGWQEPRFGVEAVMEFGIGSADFQNLVVDGRLKWDIVPTVLSVASRLRVGSASDGTPRQKHFSIGGFGTVPGYPQNEYVGNRMVLFQSDLLATPLPHVLPGLRIILSNDLGAVAVADSAAGLLEGFPGEARNYLYSPGIYLGTRTGTIRIGVAWRTDIAETPRFVIRLNERF
jgi:hypothetical protein